MTKNTAQTFRYKELFSHRKDKTKYRFLSKEGVRLERFKGRPVLVINPRCLAILGAQATKDVSFLLRPSQLKAFSSILKDQEASANDKMVAGEMLKNAAVAGRFELPLCQDTGTVLVMAKKGERVWTGVDDAAWLSKGIWTTYAKENLRYSQVIPVTMYEEKNSGNNLPAEINIRAVPGMEYHFLFVAKGGGSANKTYLFQETRARLNPQALLPFLVEKMRGLGTAACPPYHIAFAIGGTSAEMCLKTVKLAGTGELDDLPGNGRAGALAFRDNALEKELLKQSHALGLGAKFGGKYFALDMRIIRLPRHGASCPIGLGVSCAADRNIKAKITGAGLWLEELERRPEKYLPQEKMNGSGQAMAVNLNGPMAEILSRLNGHGPGTRLSLTGRLIVARDIAHARLEERLSRGEGLPQYFKDHPVYYAGPAKTPPGKPSGSFGPTTSGRMDSYLDLFMSQGASLITIGKGNRSPVVAQACRKHGGFYLGSIGGAAAVLAERSIKKVAVLDYPELGMESVWAIDVVDFPAVILTDNRGNDFFETAQKITAIKK